jgi:hypothetical protein
MSRTPVVVIMSLLAAVLAASWRQRITFFTRVKSGERGTGLSSAPMSIQVGLSRSGR